MFCISYFQTSVEHNAQVILYTLLMSERFKLFGSYTAYMQTHIHTHQRIILKDLFCLCCLVNRYQKTIDSGLLYYLQTDQTQVRLCCFKISSSLLKMAILLIYIYIFDVKKGHYSSKIRLSWVDNTA